MTILNESVKDGSRNLCQTRADARALTVKQQLHSFIQRPCVESKLNLAPAPPEMVTVVVPRAAMTLPVRMMVEVPVAFSLMTVKSWPERPVASVRFDTCALDVPETLI